MITNLTFTNRLSQTMLATAGFALASAAFLVAPANADTLTVKLNDATNGNPPEFPTVEVKLSQDAPGGPITATVNVVPGPSGYIGDLRGVFLNLPAGSSITPGDKNITTHTAGVLDTKGNKTTTEFPGIGNSAILDGVKESFNYGMEIGNQGIADGDDFQTTTFTISGTGLSLSAFTSSSFGVRMMSVGVPGGGRNDSSKTIGTAPSTVTVTPPGGGGDTTGGGGDTTGGGGDTTGGGGDTTGGGGDTTGGGGDTTGGGGDPVAVPEPMTIGGLLVGAGGLLAARRRKVNKNG
ncbi:PEP-CTERM sorting domain-containing protein [Oscillatoria acuminata]|uniref:PEP-CTERM putative exosortase interaction domain-containing protein n=1 Tax=Oscillatoria acuminata PCC 6304 TaxID=56110 RepID=K9TG02_9CYAN|nr:PEP-CTERM putative exosortase interaction domain-containing protein [Oscillatoria acuminata PCC 6304]